jgi:hypothetical protein
MRTAIEVAFQASRFVAATNWGGGSGDDSCAETALVCLGIKTLFQPLIYQEQSTADRMDTGQAPVLLSITKCF